MENKKILELLIEIKAETAKTSATMDHIQEDLAYHIMRTDLLEKKIDDIDGDRSKVKGVLKFIGLLAVIVGILKGVGLI